MIYDTLLLLSMLMLACPLAVLQTMQCCCEPDNPVIDDCPNCLTGTMRQFYRVDVSGVADGICDTCNAYDGSYFYDFGTTDCTDSTITNRGGKFFNGVACVAQTTLSTSLVFQGVPSELVRFAGNAPAFNFEQSAADQDCGSLSYSLTWISDSTDCDFSGATATVVTV